MAYNTATIRQLLIAALDDETLNTYCFAHARPVHKQFVVGQTKGQRVHMLLEYAVAHNQVEELLQWIEKENPYQYSAFRPQLLRSIDTPGNDMPEEDAPIKIQRLPRSLQKYDVFFEQWVRELTRLDHSPHNFARSVIAGLAAALQAELGFVLVNRGGTWEPTITLDDRAAHEVRQMTDSSSVRELLHQAFRHQTASCTGPIGDIEPLLFAPLINSNPPALLVFTRLRTSLVLDETIEVVLETILETTRNLTVPVESESLELRVYDALHRRIGRVSEAMYNRQFDIFSRRLRQMAVYFEPIIYLHPTQPYIWGWEALARDPATQRAPVDLFQIADLWGTRFQLELDMHFLKKAIHSYTCDTSKMSDQRRVRASEASENVGFGKLPLRTRKEELQPLTVNAYAVSLVRTRYFELLRELYLHGPMPLNKLIIEISEKSDLPKPEGSDAYREPYDWFRDRLQRLEQFDVRFAIDDFGVGLASPERLARLGVAVVKIDRNALLHRFGDSTINYVTEFARAVPGHVQVIVEGVDHESLFSLRALFDAHIRYVQGHRLGMARPDVGRLTRQEVDRICAALNAPAQKPSR